MRGDKEMNCKRHPATAPQHAHSDHFRK
jgi:hypothetical protein